MLLELADARRRAILAGGHASRPGAMLDLPVPRRIGGTMSFVLQPWQLVVVALAGWINQQQQEVIEYPNGQKARPSIKAFGNGDLSLAKSRDFGRGALVHRFSCCGISSVTYWPFYAYVLFDDRSLDNGLGGRFRENTTKTRVSQ